jgi:hypothetical protein
MYDIRNKTMHLILLLIFMITVSPASAAAVDFIDGKWETTFDCAEATQSNYGGCDGASIYGGWTCHGTPDAITVGANYSEGGGDNGFRHYQGDGTNNNGGGINFTLTNPAPELWTRFYIRYAEGFKFSYLNYDKIIYPLMNGGAASWVLDFVYGDEIAVVDEQGSSNWCRADGYGYPYIYPGGVSDGSWHCIEVYIKVNTDTGVNNGIARIWIDGALVGEKATMNFTGGSSAALQGTKYMRIGSNQAEPDNGGCTPVDFDDIVMYNTTPPNRDTEGNAFIGPIGSPGDNTSPPSTALNAPENLRTVQAQ